MKPKKNSKTQNNRETNTKLQSIKSKNNQQQKHTRTHKGESKKKSKRRGEHVSDHETGHQEGKEIIKLKSKRTSTDNKRQTSAREIAT